MFKYLDCDNMIYHQCRKERFLIAIEGNIGSGKSTLLKKLKQLGYITEPQDIKKMNQYLIPYYSNRHKKGVALRTQKGIWSIYEKKYDKYQLNGNKKQEIIEYNKRFGKVNNNYVYFKVSSDISMNKNDKTEYYALHQIKKANDQNQSNIIPVDKLKKEFPISKKIRNDIVVIEGILSSHSVFAKNDYLDKCLTDNEFSELKKKYSAEGCNIRPDLVILLRPTVQECSNRIKKRNRNNGESGIKREYLESIDKRYTELINSDNIKCPILVLENHWTTDDNVSFIEHFISYIKK